MTIDELIERLKWQKEGRLQYRKGMACDGPEWFDWPANSHIMLVLGDRADFYRCRPDPPTMPDEVWLNPNHEWMNGSRLAKEQQDHIHIVRYVRAGAVIPASRMQWRHVVSNMEGEWKDESEPSIIEYRIKP